MYKNDIIIMAIIGYSGKTFNKSNDASAAFLTINLRVTNNKNKERSN